MERTDLTRFPCVKDPPAMHCGQGQRLKEHVGHRVLDVDRGLGDPDQDHLAALPQQAEAVVDHRRCPCSLDQPRHSVTRGQGLDLGLKVLDTGVEGDQRTGEAHLLRQLQPKLVNIGDNDTRASLSRSALSSQETCIVYTVHRLA